MARVAVFDNSVAFAREKSEGSSASRVDQGSGQVGRSVSQKIVRERGGKIPVVSEPGEGRRCR